MSNTSYYIFVDESGDPGKPFKTDQSGAKILTGASLYYVLSAVCVDSKTLFVLEDRMLEIKHKYGYKKEIKSTDVSLGLYKDLLSLINELNIKVFYRAVDKAMYKGTFAIPGDKKLHNIFDEYNLVKVTAHAIKKYAVHETEVVVDRTDRRLLSGNFDNFNNYLKSKVNTKTLLRVRNVTHVNSEYVNAMQMSDLISGALKDHLTKRNTDLKKVIQKRLLVKVF